MEGQCSNCRRLIFDTEKLDDLPDQLECQHCHYINRVRSICKRCGLSFIGSNKLAGHTRREHKRAKREHTRQEVVHGESTGKYQ